MDWIVTAVLDAAAFRWELVSFMHDDDFIKIFCLDYENGALSGRFFLSKGDDIKIKRKFSRFSLPLSVYFPSLPSYLYFLPFYMAWTRPFK